MGLIVSVDMVCERRRDSGILKCRATVLWSGVVLARR
jgi:hypothetical protein